MRGLRKEPLIAEGRGHHLSAIKATRSLLVASLVSGGGRGWFGREKKFLRWVQFSPC